MIACPNRRNLWLDDLLERYLYVQKMSCGKEFDKSFFFVAMTDGELDKFLEWKDEEEARQHPCFRWTKLNAVVRKYLKENHHLIWEKPLYEGAGWTRFTYGECCRMEEWKRHLKRELEENFL